MKVGWRMMQRRAWSAEGGSEMEELNTSSQIEATSGSFGSLKANKEAHANEEDRWQMRNPNATYALVLEGRLLRLSFSADGE